MTSLSLPTNWECEDLGAIVVHGKGKIPRKFKDEPSNTYLPYIDIHAFETGVVRRYATTEKTTVIDNEDVLIVWDGARFGLAGKGREGVLGSTLVRLRSEALVRDYLFYFVKSNYHTINSRPRGTGTPHVEPDVFWSLKIPVPPLREQARIVDKIETLFTRIDKGEEALREVQRQLRVYRQSVLKAAVTGELTRDWRAANKDCLEPASELLDRIRRTRRAEWSGRVRYKEPVAPGDFELPAIPDEWTWATLPMLGEFGRGKSKHRPRNDERLYENGKHPFLQTGRVRSSKGRVSEYDKLYNDFGLSQSKLWPSGTVCITIAANIAESGILDIDACFPDSVVGLVPHDGVVGEYVEMFIRTAKEDLDRYAPATAQKNINLEILNDVAVPLPPTDEQYAIRQFVNQAFSQAAQVERACETEVGRLSRLRQSILKDAFSGRLVSQDPSDESASELVARIKADNSAASRKKRRRAGA